MDWNVASYPPTMPAVHNLTNIHSGSLDLGIVDSTKQANAVNKSGRFQFNDSRYDNLRSLVSLNRIRLTSITANTYTSNPAPVDTFEVKATLITSEELDEESAYIFVKTLFENLPHPASVLAPPVDRGIQRD